MSEPSRRRFLQAAGAAAGPLILGGPAAAQAKTLKIALVGCGGRGKGAVAANLEAAKMLGLNVQVVALADWFGERAVAAGKQFGVPAERCFGGPDSYRRVMATDADLVLLVAAPAFRPLHLETALAAGKHAFVEKPVAIDPPGCRRVIAAGELAKQRGLVVVAGTEQRHQWEFRNTHQAVAVEGALGKLLAGRVSFCIAHMFATRPIEPKTADDLIRGWQNWVCLSGDHLVEQHVHNIDIALWFAGRPPVSCVGFGGRARRRAGDQYDFFSIDYDWGDGVHIHSMCRQVAGCWNWIGHDLVYEKGHTNGTDGPRPRVSPIPADLPRGNSGHLQEQLDVLYYVARGEPLDEARAVAESSAAAVMGRIAAYTGKQVTWAEMMTEPARNPAVYDLTLKPTAEEFETGQVTLPVENVVPAAGVTVN